MTLDESPELSVLIATHNGAAYLSRVLNGYLALGEPDFRWEIIIVDNASTDRTSEIIADFAQRLPIVARFESKPGKNRALNSGLSSVRSEIIVLSDDDAIPHAGFLTAWRAAFLANPEVDLFGGSIVPLFDIPLPDWMSKAKPHFEELYSRRECVPTGPIEADYIFGPNMAVRRRVTQGGIMFDEGVGPRAGQKIYAMGSETAFCRAVAEAGYTLWFDSAPTVSHIVRGNQVTPAYIHARARRMGYGTARKQFLDGKIQVRPAQGLRQFFRVARNLLRRAVSRLALLTPNVEARFEARWQIEFDRGYQMGVTQLRAEAFHQSGAL